MHLQKHLGIHRYRHLCQHKAVQSSQNRRLVIHRHQYRVAGLHRLDMDQVQRNRYLQQR